MWKLNLFTFVDSKDITKRKSKQIIEKKHSKKYHEFVDLKSELNRKP